MNYIMHCKIKRDNHRVTRYLKLQRYPGIKQNNKNLQITKNKQVHITIDTEFITLFENIS